MCHILKSGYIFSDTARTSESGIVLIIRMPRNGNILLAVGLKYKQNETLLLSLLFFLKKIHTFAPI